MARIARKKSESGFYHVIIRGIGKQILFEEKSDYIRFLNTLERYLDSHTIQLHAYCLMDNHVHMLVRDPDEKLDVFMKQLEGSYAFYFNHKYERTGVLFQDRFKSEPVEDDAYFAVVLRYILQNPQKAGIGTTENYPWNSYKELVNGPVLTQPEFALSCFGGKEQLLEFIRADNEDVCLEPSSAPVGETRAKQIIREKLHLESGTQLQAMERKNRDEALRNLKQQGLSVRQIERLTGINRGVIQKA